MELHRDNPPRSCKLQNKKPIAKYWIIDQRSLIEYPKQLLLLCSYFLQILMVRHCQWQHYTLWYGDIKVVLTEKIPFHFIVFIVSEDALPVLGEKRHHQPLLTLWAAIKTGISRYTHECNSVMNVMWITNHFLMEFKGNF